jgi:hypothetical protein
MTCKPTQRDRISLQSLEEKFRVTSLKPEGRLQFFYHCPHSALPIRDVIGKKKQEPHIEQNAENYCRECYQNNIRGFLKSREKYLFLFTTCASRERALRRFYGERLIVGYIIKKRWLRRRTPRGIHYAVQGFTKMVPFEAAFNLSKFGTRARHWRVKSFGERETSRIREHLDLAKNIRTRCIHEIERLKKVGSHGDRTCR